MAVSTDYLLTAPESKQFLESMHSLAIDMIS